MLEIFGIIYVLSFVICVVTCIYAVYLKGATLGEILTFLAIAVIPVLNTVVIFMVLNKAGFFRKQIIKGRKHG